jgi:hypothetical protein
VRPVWAKKRSACMGAQAGGARTHTHTVPSWLPAAKHVPDAFHAHAMPESDASQKVFTR